MCRGCPILRQVTTRALRSQFPVCLERANFSMSKVKLSTNHGDIVVTGQVSGALLQYSLDMQINSHIFLQAEELH